MYIVAADGLLKEQMDYFFVFLCMNLFLSFYIYGHIVK